MVTFELFEEPHTFLGGLDLDEAMDLWRRASCEEFTGGKHPFELTVEESRASVSCPVCRYNPLEEGDLWEYLSFGPVPVNVEIRSIVYPGGPWGGTEYDVEVEVTPRG